MSRRDPYALRQHPPRARPEGKPVGAWGSSRAPYASQEACQRVVALARLLGARVRRERAYASEHNERPTGASSSEARASGPR